MSIKIYNGYKFKTTNFLDILESIKYSKIKLEKILREKFLEEFVNTFIELYSEQLLYGYNDKKSLGIKEDKLKESYILYVLKNMNSEKEIDLYFSDFNGEICLFPSKSETLGLLYFNESSKQLFLNYLKEKIEIEEYNYYDNVDKPKNIKIKEWKNRKEIWNNVLLDGSGIPSIEGLVNHINKRNITSVLFSLEEKEKINILLKNKNIIDYTNNLKSQKDFDFYIKTLEEYKTIEQLNDSKKMKEKEIKKIKEKYKEMYENIKKDNLIWSKKVIEEVNIETILSFDLKFEN